MGVAGGAAQMLFVENVNIVSISTSVNQRFERREERARTPSP
jgi:hypothetical protein